MPNIPLAVAGLGMVSCLGIGAAFNAAAMRCGYSGASTLSEQDERLVAQAPLPATQRGSERLVNVLLPAVQEALQTLPAGAQVPLYVCTETNDLLRDPCPGLANILYQQLHKQPYAACIDYDHSKHVPQGRVSFVHALNWVQHQATQHQYHLVVGIASYLFPHSLNYYQGLGRLLGPDNPDAFIPGEAAVAVLLDTQPRGSTSVLLGHGLGTEPHPIDGDQPITGDGLTAAVRAAEADSGVTSNATDFRISSASGEAYFFRELSIVHGRTLDDPKQDHPLWHPADHIGEVGAASGAAMVVMAHYAFQKNYAPGHTALCQLSNDDTQRAAYLIRYQPDGLGETTQR